MPQFLITALGSYGDVHPMAGLGGALVARGHRVKIITSPYFDDVVAASGAELVPLGTREEYVELSRHSDLWHPIRGPKLVLSHTVGRLLRPIYDLLLANYEPGNTVYCAHPLDLAARVAGEKINAPVASLVLAPGVLWSLYDSPRLKGAFLGPRVPRWLKQVQYWAADRFFSQPLLGGPLNRLRAEEGLPPVDRIFQHWLFRSDLMLGLFPDWFGPPQIDWPPNSQTVGFPLWDAPNIKSSPAGRGQGKGALPHDRSHANASGADGSASALSSDLQDFLASGTSPIAFSPGSANNEAHQFFAAAVTACQRLGRRGILLTKYDHQLPPNLPASVRHVGFVPLSKLLPHAAALVHHGGIGNCAQGFAAGIPQIIRPMSYDQFDNSRRVAGLGVGAEISVKRFTGEVIATRLDSLLASTAIAARCQELASRCNGPAALSAACDALEQLASVHAAR